MGWKVNVAQNLGAVIGIASCVGGAAFAGWTAIDQHGVITSALGGKYQKPDSGRHCACPERLEPASTTAQKHCPPRCDDQNGQGSGVPAADPEGQAGLLLARASYDVAYWSFLAMLVFGVVAVLGIYLTFFEARDALDAQRPHRRGRRAKVQ